MFIVARQLGRSIKLARGILTSFLYALASGRIE